MARDDRDEDAIDPTRREFFRHFGRESIRNAGAVAGAAAEIRRAGNVAARDILDMAGPPSKVAPVEREPVVESGFSSAYRLGDGRPPRARPARSARSHVDPVACRAVGGLVGDPIWRHQRRTHPGRGRRLLVGTCGCPEDWHGSAESRSDIPLGGEHAPNSALRRSRAASCGGPDGSLVRAAHGRC